MQPRLTHIQGSLDDFVFHRENLLHEVFNGMYLSLQNQKVEKESSGFVFMF